MKLAFDPGQRFGSLVVLAIRPGTKGSPRRIECRCDCGENYLVVPHRLHVGEVTRCFACMPKRRTVEHIRFRRRLNNYVHSSARKNLAFTFTAEEFRKFYDAACEYCGSAPAGGIDRQDNALGYVEGNCVPACAQCNYAKRNLSLADFTAWLSRIAAHQGYSL